MEQIGLARWLKVILAGMGLCGIIVFFVIIPDYGQSLATIYPEYANRFLPWLMFLWVCGIPLFAILVLGWIIASNIGKDKSFSNENALYLKWISHLAAGDGIFFFIGNVVLLLLSMSHPGIVLYSLFVVFACVAVSVAAASLSHLVKKAAVLQEQSDLTI